jgi:hypothetical protein
MKKIILTLAIVTSITMADAQIQIPALSPAGLIQQQIGLAKVSVNYHMPSLRGRKLLGQANIPYGKVWRLGANEVTTIEVNDAIDMQGNVLSKGKYALVAIPDASEWTIIVNKDNDQWGVYSYNEGKDVFRFKVKATPLSSIQETMSFTFEEITPTSGTLVFKWENITFKIPFSQKNADEKVMMQIKEKTTVRKPSMDDLMESAEYYLMMNKDLEQALKWATEVVNNVKSPFRYNLQAQIAAKLGKCEIAIAAANGAIEYAKKSKDDAAIALAESIIKACSAK